MMDRMGGQRRALLGVLVASMVSGCVSTQVNSYVVSAPRSAPRQVAVVLAGGSFSAGNIAGSLGQKNLDQLAPSLQRRLTGTLTLNGLPARWWSAGTDSLQSDESLLVISPASATYSSRTGQTLVITASLRDGAGSMPYWQASIRMATLGFGQFNDGVADDIASQLLQRLRSDKILAGSGSIQLMPPTK
jgi:hypothetical protein